jgi:hypothetical protein
MEKAYNVSLHCSSTKVTIVKNNGKNKVTLVPFKYYALEGHKGMEVKINSICTSELHEGEWHASRG